MPLILLAEPELAVYIPALAATKDLTHWRMCAFKAETPRPNHLKPGYLDIWFAKCYFDDGNVIEASGIPGPFDGGRYRLEGEELEVLQAQLTVGGLPATYECMVAILTAMLVLGLLDGTLIPETWEIPQ